MSLTERLEMRPYLTMSNFTEFMSIQTLPLPQKAKPTSRRAVSSGTLQVTVNCVQSRVPLRLLSLDMLSLARMVLLAARGLKVGWRRTETFSVLTQPVRRTVWPRYLFGLAD